MSLAWTLRVQIEKGINFNLRCNKNESNGVFIRCLFNHSINQSSITPLFMDKPLTFNEALEWQFDDKILKKLKRTGSSIKLQIFLLQNWNPSLLSFPIHLNPKRTNKYNVKDIGYIVLDLKTAILNGSKIKNVNNSQLQTRSTFMRIRNAKMVKNNGIHPEIKIAFWCLLQTKWVDDNYNENQKLSPKSVPKLKEKEDEDEDEQQDAEYALYTHNNQNIDQQNTVVIKQNNNNNNNESVYCVIHEIESFINLSPLRLLITSQNENNIINLPLNTATSNIKFSNNSDNLCLYLQSSINGKWNILGSYSFNIQKYISLNHDTIYPIKLFALSTNKCIVKLAISISFEEYFIVAPTTTNINIIEQTVVIPKQKQQIEIIPNDQLSVTSEYTNVTVATSQQESEIEICEQKDQETEIYLPFNKLEDNNHINQLNKFNINIDINDNNAYKYRIGIDIRSVRDLRDSYCIQCKYKYFLFDNNHLFSTNPAILINKCEEKTINNGFCAYELLSKPNKLYLDFIKYPLMIQVIHKDSLTNDIEIGWCFINLSQLLIINKSSTNLRYIDKYCTIYSRFNDNNNDINDINLTNKDLENIKCKPMGNIRVCCSLEDYKIENEEKLNNDNQIDENQIIDPRRKVIQHVQHFEKEIISELQKWKYEQQTKIQERFKLLEIKKLNDLENEWKKQELERINNLNCKQNEIIQLEKKLKISLYDIESQDKKLKFEEIRILERKKELEQSYKLKISEIISSVKRIRNDNKYEIETLNRTINFLKNENDLIQIKYKNEEKRCNDVRNELNKQKKQFNLSSIGQLKISNNKLLNNISELTAKLNDKNDNIAELNKINEKNQLKIQNLYNDINQKEKEKINNEKKQIEKLKLELMTKTHFKQIRNDRNELQQIKNTLNKIMNNTHNK